MTTLVLIAVVAFATSIVVVRLLLRSPQSAPLDVPDARKLHTTPTPRGGGLGILLGVLAALPLVVLLTSHDWRDVVAVISFALANGILGFIDDRRPMRSRVKFVIQIIFSVAAYAGGIRIVELPLPFLGSVALSWVSAPLTVLWLVWVTNLYNFMDGLDALAAGAALLWSTAIAVLVVPEELRATMVALAGALVGFLVYNRPPAKIFMGDVGSFFVGGLFAAALVGLNRGSEAPLPITAAVLLCGPFVWDATYTIVWRAVRGEDWLHPHKRHLFQRLVLSGLSRSRVRWLYLVASLAFALVGVAYPKMTEAQRLATLAAALVACAGYSIAVGRFEAGALRAGRHADSQAPT